MRVLGELAGVSTQAVSLALRNHPSVGAETRARIQALARREGYTPDPHLAKLMHHLRGRKAPKLTASVCALTTRPSKSEERFCDLLADGAKRAARAAGFAFHVLHLDAAEMAGERLPRVLRQRGVEGLVLLPMANLEALDTLVNWEDFSVVSATLSVTSPLFDRVVADHFQNNFSLGARLQAEGFRRPGLVIHQHHDRRCGHSITAAYAWHGAYGGVEAVRAHVCEKVDAAALRAWLKTEKPDVVLAEHDALARQLRETGVIQAGLPLVSCSARPLADGTFPFAGNYDNPEEIGAAAVAELARKIATGQRGIPERPHTTLVRGKWVDGKMAPAGPRPKPGATGGRGGS
jgi:DNA-binding LacI/PurR family transcriptional regulator